MRNVLSPISDTTITAGGSASALARAARDERTDGAVEAGERGDPLEVHASNLRERWDETMRTRARGESRGEAELGGERAFEPRGLGRPAIQVPSCPPRLTALVPRLDRLHASMPVEITVAGILFDMDGSTSRRCVAASLPR